jgi:hypothetical protein
LGGSGARSKPRSRRLKAVRRARNRANGETRASASALVAEAGYALWLFVVQREALGFA